jgi:hypothetical protein
MYYKNTTLLYLTIVHASYTLTIDDVANCHSWLPAILLFLLLENFVELIKFGHPSNFGPYSGLNLICVPFVISLLWHVMSCFLVIFGQINYCNILDRKIYCNISTNVLSTVELL